MLPNEEDRFWYNALRRCTEQTQPDKPHGAIVGKLSNSPLGKAQQARA